MEEQQQQQQQQEEEEETVITSIGYIVYTPEDLDSPTAAKSDPSEVCGYLNVTADFYNGAIQQQQQQPKCTECGTCVPTKNGECIMKGLENTSGQSTELAREKYLELKALNESRFRTLREKYTDIDGTFNETEEYKEENIKLIQAIILENLSVLTRQSLSRESLLLYFTRLYGSRRDKWLQNDNNNIDTSSYTTNINNDNESDCIDYSNIDGCDSSDSSNDDVDISNCKWSWSCREKWVKNEECEHGLDKPCDSDCEEIHDDECEHGLYYYNDDCYESEYECYNTLYPLYRDSIKGLVRNCHGNNCKIHCLWDCKSCNTFDSEDSNDSW